MQINPYLSFNGQCEAAFTHCEKVLGGKIAMLSRFGETPDCRFGTPWMVNAGMKE
jgi:PhnB protein